MSQKPKFSRKTYVIDRKQQAKFAMTLGLYGLLYPLVLFFFVLVPPFSNILVDPAKVEPLMRQVVGFHITHWWLVLLTLMVIAGLSVILSHAIFGPVYKFQKVLQESLQNPGESVKITLRRADYFKGFAEVLEDFLNQVAERKGKASE